MGGEGEWAERMNCESTWKSKLSGWAMVGCDEVQWDLIQGSGRRQRVRRWGVCNKGRRKEALCECVRVCVSVCERDVMGEGQAVVRFKCCARRRCDRRKKKRRVRRKRGAICSRNCNFSTNGICWKIVWATMPKPSPLRVFADIR
jgi:hypothetical protein